jgi:hypothetical protein
LCCHSTTWRESASVTRFDRRFAAECALAAQI